MPTFPPVCNQAARQTFRPVSIWDPFTTDVENYPPVPRPPEPPPPDPPPIRQLYVPPATVGWDQFDAYWWALLADSCASADDSYFARLIDARGSSGTKHTNLQPDESPILRMRWASMQDRFVVVIGGTTNEQQALLYTLSHAYGLQVNRPYGWANSTFAIMALLLASHLRADWIAAGRQPLCIIGHSYGGGVAPLVYLELLDREKDAFDRVVTLAAPRMATDSMVASIKSVQWVRIVNPGDPVPDQPPPAGIVRLIVGPALVGGYPGGEYGPGRPALTLAGSDGIIPTIATPPTVALWAAQFYQFVAGGLDLVPHYCRSYVDPLGQWVGQPVPGFVLGWRNFADIGQVDADLKSIGL